jgi:hypothetical protein
LLECKSIAAYSSMSAPLLCGFRSGVATQTIATGLGVG